MERKERVIGDGVRLSRTIATLKIPLKLYRVAPGGVRRCASWEVLTVAFHTQLLLLTTVIEEPRKEAVRGAMYMDIKYGGQHSSAAARPIRVRLLPRDPITGAPAV